MAESHASPLGRWRNGMHPNATGMRIRSLGRVRLNLGDALRLELETGPDGDDLVHLQYYIVTDVGPWALWLSCAPEDVADNEASLRELTPEFVEEQQA
jgi:hypothetical protein